MSRKTKSNIFEINLFVPKKKFYETLQGFTIDYSSTAIVEREFSVSTLSWRSSVSYRHQSIDLHSKLMDWFYMIGTSVVKLTLPSTKLRNALTPNSLTNAGDLDWGEIIDLHKFPKKP